MASMQQGDTYGADFSFHTYRSHVTSGIKIGTHVVGAAVVPCLFCFGFIQLLSGIIFIAIDAGSYFGPGSATIVGSILLVIGVLLIVGGITLACIAYNSYKNTQVANPEQPFNPTGGAYLQGSSMPYPGAGTSAYSPDNTQGAGFSSQYSYSPSPVLTGQPGGISHPPPQPGFFGQAGSSSYQPPPGFSGQPEGTSYPPPPSMYSEKPGIDHPPYDSSTPSAPEM